MNGIDIKFDARLRMTFEISQEKESVTLVLSDALRSSRQELHSSYRNKIADFINRSESWYQLCLDRIRKENNKPGKIQLMRLYILSEQDEDPITFGLSFRVKFDIEHGRGLKIDGSSLNILDYGDSDVAFS